VIVTDRTMRKLVVGQSILSFFFNMAILGFSINIAAGMLNQWSSGWRCQNGKRRKIKPTI
jgi:hypothetical protein